MIGTNDIWNRFGFHRATQSPNFTAEQHWKLRREFINFATRLCNNLPDVRETRIALERLEEASMWTHKALASQDPLEKEDYDGDAKPDSEG